MNGCGDKKDELSRTDQKHIKEYTIFFNLKINEALRGNTLNMSPELKDRIQALDKVLSVVCSKGLKLQLTKITNLLRGSASQTIVFQSQAF